MILTRMFINQVGDWWDNKPETRYRAVSKNLYLYVDHTLIVLLDRELQDETCRLPNVGSLA